jgi:hypothetical protein
MLFAGRKTETKFISESLRHGKNIILSGKCGIGRTALIKEISHLFSNERKFVFVDFSQTPGKMSEKLMRELGLSCRLKKTGRKMGYKSMRYRIANVMVSHKNKPVIIFDNIAKLTPQKIIFLRNLIEENHFQFIAIVENFLSATAFPSLQALLFPADCILLNRLKNTDVACFLHLYSNKYKLNWTDHYIHDLTAIAGGHPLSMMEMIKNKRGEIHDRKI